MNKLKVPRIYHLPWSQSLNKDDKYIHNNNLFVNKQVVILVKYDGESTSLYSDGTFHARSLYSKSNPSRDWLHNWWSNIVFTDEYKQLLIKYPDLRLVGENMYAVHTIKYNNLPDFFILHSAWNELTCLSWDETEAISILLNMSTAAVLYRGLYVESIAKLYNSLELYNHDPIEGYIIRNSQSYNYLDSDNNIAKFVSSNFKIDDTKKHWTSQTITRNNIKQQYN